MDMASTFRYQPLDEPSKQIRLVNLDPGASDEDEITCTLCTADASSVSYAALSYTWGDPNATSPIILNGQPFQITSNLRSALQVLRRQGREWNTKRLLWIDAICIDQANDHERGQQVQLMKSIYKSAHHVFIWLGNYHEAEDALVLSPASNWGFDSLEPGNLTTTQQAFQLALSLSNGYNVADGIGGYLHGISPPNLDPYCWAYLSRLYRRPWFERLWVVQELAVARKAVVLCGECMIAWETLEGSARAIGAHIRSRDRSMVGQLPFIYNLCHVNVTIPSILRVDRTDILSLIHRFRHSKATDPLDRLYAIKNLLETEDSDISIDYATPVEDAYRNWAIKRIQRTKSLDVLSICTDSSRRSGAQPFEWSSWVPDLRDLSGVDANLFFHSNGIRPDERNLEFAASGRTKCVEALFPFQEGSSPFLCVRGIFVGQIVKIMYECGILGIPVLSSKLVSVVAKWEEEVTGHFTHSLGSITSLDTAFIDALFRGQVSFGEEGNLPTLQTRYKVWRDHAPIPAEFEPSMSQEERLKAYLGHFETIIALMISNSQMFITSRGSIGVISSKCHATVGDDVYVLLGGNTPFVLAEMKPTAVLLGSEEELQSRSGHKQVIGPCYVHDFMDGQAIASWRNGDLKLEDIIMF